MLAGREPEHGEVVAEVRAVGGAGAKTASLREKQSFTASAMVRKIGVLALS